MDTLSQFIQLLRPEVKLDLRCLLGEKFSIPHEPSPEGEAPFHLVLEGECTIETSEFAQIKMKAGDFIMFPRGSAHTICNAQVKNGGVEPSVTLLTNGILPIKSNVESFADVEFLCGRFKYAKTSGSLLLTTFPDPLHVSLLGHHSLGELHAMISLLHEEAINEKPGSLAIISMLTQALLVMALRIHSEHAIENGLLRLFSDHRLGESVKALLTDPSQNWTIEKLAKLAYMSRATYARQFENKSGMSVGDFLLRVRMQHACNLLEQTNRCVASIGEDVGYQSEAAFGKAFKRGIGMPPSFFRKNLIS